MTDSTLRLPARPALTNSEERTLRKAERALRKKHKKSLRRAKSKQSRAASSSESSSSDEAKEGAELSESEEEETDVPGASEGRRRNKPTTAAESEDEPSGEEEEGGEEATPEAPKWWMTNVAKRLIFRDKPVQSEETVAPCSSAPGFFVHVCESASPTAASLAKTLRCIKDTKCLGTWRKQFEECGVLALGMPAKHITFDRSQLCQADLWFLQNDHKANSASISMVDLRNMLGLPSTMTHIVVTRLAVHQTSLHCNVKSVLGGACDLLCGQHSLTKRAVAIGKPGGASSTVAKWVSVSEAAGLERKSASSHHQVTVFNVTTNVNSSHHGGGVPPGLAQRSLQKSVSEEGATEPTSFFIPSLPQATQCDVPYVVSAADPCLFEDTSPAHLWIGHPNWTAAITECRHVELQGDNVLLDVVDSSCPSRAASIYALIVLHDQIVNKGKTLNQLIECKILIGDDTDISTRSRLCVPVSYFQPLVALHASLYDCKHHSVLDTTATQDALHLRYRLIGQRANDTISDLSLAARVSVEFYAGGACVSL
jgi:hypothetical protein